MARPDEERPGSGSHWVKSSLSFSNGNCVEVANLAEGGVAGACVVPGVGAFLCGFVEDFIDGDIE